MVMQKEQKKDIRIRAERFRENCKINRYGIIDLFKECERCGYKLLRYPLGEEAALGFVTKKDTDMIIFTNTSVRLSRELFTLAHEIGHILLHMENMDSFVDDKKTIFGKGMDEREREANYFAACLLMPEDEVEKFLDLELDSFEKYGLSAIDIARIMSEFNVSFDMALNRLENLHKINSDERLKLDSERNQVRVGNLLKSVGGNSRLNVASMEMDIPYEYMNYVIYNYNHHAIPLETLERALGYYNLSIEDIHDKIVSHLPEEEELDALIGGLDD